MRRNPPRLVMPHLDGELHVRRRLGVPTLGDLRRDIAKQEQRREERGRAASVTGSWKDGTAQRSLLRALARLGLVIDDTTEK